MSQCFSTIGSPAVFKNGLTVGATLNDNQAWLAYYSSSATGGSGGYGGEFLFKFTWQNPARYLGDLNLLEQTQMTVGLGRSIPSTLSLDSHPEVLHPPNYFANLC